MTGPAASFSLRVATAADAAAIGGHRAAMFRDMGSVADDETAEALARAAADYLAGSLADGTYAGWLAVDAAGLVVGGAGVQLRPIVPRPRPGGGVLTGPQALLLNVYTVPAWRGRGVAAALVGRALEWAEARGCSSVVLHASDAGRALYERLGFRPTNEMQFHGAPRRPDPRSPSP